MNDEEVNEQELDRFEERYFGTLSDAQAAAFDGALERDAELRARYDLFVLSVRGIRSGGATADAAKSEALRAQFRVIDRELDGAQVPVRRLFQPWMGWAAAVLVLLGVGRLWWLGRGDTPQQLADEFAIAEPGLPVLMGTSPKVMDAIMNAYKQDDLAMAGQLLASAVQQDPENDTLLYFSGVVAEREQGCAQADGFAQVPEGSVFWSKARYHTALCTLRAGDIVATRTVLNAVAQGDDAQLATRARDLLKRLETM